jgi:hypothetical protein
MPHGKDYLMEVVNRGGVTMREFEWQFPPEAENWFVITDVLPEYPIGELQPRDYVRVPVSLAMQGPVMVDVLLRAKTESGEAYQTSVRLSVFG